MFGWMVRGLFGALQRDREQQQVVVFRDWRFGPCQRCTVNGITEDFTISNSYENINQCVFK